MSHRENSSRRAPLPEKFCRLPWEAKQRKRNSCNGSLNLLPAEEPLHRLHHRAQVVFKSDTQDKKDIYSTTSFSAVRHELTNACFLDSSLLSYLHLEPLVETYIRVVQRTSSQSNEETFCRRSLGQAQSNPTVMSVPPTQTNKKVKIEALAAEYGTSQMGHE